MRGCENVAEKIVIGLTGPFGSGCTYVAKEVLVEKDYEYISLSDLLRKEIDDNALSRSEMQNKGNELRLQKGPGYLAELAVDIIQKSDKQKFVVDSIRNTHEVDALKNAFSSFCMFAIWASKDVRWSRIQNKYHKNMALFEEDDKRDKDEKDENGQQITLCYQMADIIILNETQIPTKQSKPFIDLKSIVERYLSFIEDRTPFEPTEMETLMSMAYANSMRSSCSQRKVGALIIDDFGNVFSSGFNEVPVSQRSCKIDYGKCYRKFLRDAIKSKINDELKNEDLSNKVSDIIKNNSKMLDYCRALHAEENAIVNMARLSVSTDFSKATLYTTTYPCNLCANKIAQVGIKKIVYYEPYPQEEAKKILNAHNIKQIPFEGVTYNCYFKFMEVLR